MLQITLKNILINKLNSGFICFIKYNDGKDLFEKPFKLFVFNNNLESSQQINLIECITEKNETLFFSNIVSFRICYDDVNKSNELSNASIYLHRINSSAFDFIRGDLYYKLAFNIECLENKNILPILNLVSSVNIEDYDKVINNDKLMMIKLKQKLKIEITKKYNEVVDSIDKELQNVKDQSVKDELNSIKKILSDIPREVDDELENKIYYKDIINYWPTLLLPRSNILNIS